MILVLLFMAGLIVTSLIYFFTGMMDYSAALTCYAIVTGVIYLIIRYRYK